MRKVWIFLLLFIVSVTGCDDPVQNSLNSWVENRGESYGVKGFSANFYIPGHGNWEGYYGITTKDSGEKIDRMTLFALGSFVKSYTAAIILKLSEEGKINIDSPIGEYLEPGSYASISEHITLRQLLNQESGLYDYTENMQFWSIIGENPDKEFNDEQVLNLVETPVADIGTEYRYCNTNYYLLGMVIKEALHMDSLPEAFHSYLLKPMRLNQTFFGYDDYIGEIFNYGEAGMESNIALYSGAANAGGLFGTTGDVLQWVKKLFNGNYINSSSIKEMTTFNDGGYGMGCMRMIIAGQTVYGHIGIIPDCGSIFFYDPANGVIGVVSVNDLSGAENSIIDDLYSVVLQHQ